MEQGVIVSFVNFYVVDLTGDSQPVSRIEVRGCKVQE
jgi:hypothetical protein